MCRVTSRPVVVQLQKRRCVRNFLAKGELVGKPLFWGRTAIFDAQFLGNIGFVMQAKEDAAAQGFAGHFGDIGLAAGDAL